MNVKDSKDPELFFLLILHQSLVALVGRKRYPVYLGNRKNE
jgi:hypothetical protein